MLSLILPRAAMLLILSSMLSHAAARDLPRTFPLHRQVKVTENGELTAHLLSPSKLLALRGGVDQLQDAEEWEELLARKDTLIVVDFTASWCGPCQRIAPVFTALADEYPDVVFVKIDVDELGELAADLGVSSMPTFQMWRNGEMLDVVRGADEAKLRAAVAHLA